MLFLKQDRPDQVIIEPGGRIVIPGGRGRGAPLSDYNSLKAREKELLDQRENLEDRRGDLSRELEGKSGIDKAGIESRISIIDQRLNQIETDLIQVGMQAAQVAPASLIKPQPEIRYVNNDEDMVAAGFVGSFLTLALLSPFFFRAWRRKRKAAFTTSTAVPALGGERIDRMEQSIEAIAVEIERVSENQRFMTRLMTETQLAGTIAAVRGSTEAAKVAAERGTNA